MTDRGPISQLMAVIPELGRDAIIRLLLSYPGMDLKIPRTVDADHPLARAIGFEAASILSRKAGGMRFYISAAYAREERNRAICNAFSVGGTSEEIALQHGLTPRQVARIWRDSQ